MQGPHDLLSTVLVSLPGAPVGAGKETCSFYTDITGVLHLLMWCWLTGGDRVAAQITKHR